MTEKQYIIASFIHRCCTQPESLPKQRSKGAIISASNVILFQSTMHLYAHCGCRYLDTTKLYPLHIRIYEFHHHNKHQSGSSVITNKQLSHGQLHQVAYLLKAQVNGQEGCDDGSAAGAGEPPAALQHAQCLQDLCGK